MIKKAFERSDKELDEQIFDVIFSGTTTVTVFLVGRSRLICANCGDSRAAIGRHKAGLWQAIPVSRDHKPDLEDEKSRILASNGRIDTYRDTNGEAIGPFRVWLSDQNIPGLAMSRSLGDRLASTVGVTSEPEIFELELTIEDKFIILASDGIWEFISTEEVIKLIVPYYESGDV